jgi:hypothetical protein
MAKTLGFYQNFRLNIQRLSDALCSIQQDPEMGRADLAQCMSVNPAIAHAFSCWLRHTGLVEPASRRRQRKAMTHRLSPFGELAYRYDPALMDIGTQWVLHYHLATRRGEASDAWYTLMNKYLPHHFRFTPDQFQSYFSSLMADKTRSRLALNKDPLAALSTYTRADVLGQLNILKKRGKTYTVGQPELPPTLIIGYMLLDWWQDHYNQTDTLRFSQLCHEEESLGLLCLAEASQIRYSVVELAGLGYLSFSDTQHEPVHRLYRDHPSTLLERYYAQSNER